MGLAMSGCCSTGSKEGRPAESQEARIEMLKRDINVTTDAISSRAALANELRKKVESQEQLHWVPPKWRVNAQNAHEKIYPRDERVRDLELFLGAQQRELGAITEEIYAYQDVLRYDASKGVGSKH